MSVDPGDPGPEPVTDLFRAAEAGDPEAAGRLFASLYQELHTLAGRHVRRFDGIVTLGATTLLHEVYLAVSAREAARFPDRPRFFAYASRAMRGLVIDYARNRKAKKRGGEFQFTSLDGAEADPGPGRGGDLEQLGDALEALGRLDPPLAELVDLHFFCGFSFVEIAALRSVSERTVQRDWRKARLLLQEHFEDASA